MNIFFRRRVIGCSHITASEHSTEYWLVTKTSQYIYENLLGAVEPGLIGWTREHVTCLVENTWLETTWPVPCVISWFWSLQRKKYKFYIIVKHECWNRKVFGYLVEIATIKIWPCEVIQSKPFHWKQNIINIKYSLDKYRYSVAEMKLGRNVSRHVITPSVEIEY